MDRSTVNWLPDTPADPAHTRRVAELAGLVEPVEVVDVGANPLDDEAPYAPLLRAGVGRVTGFEPQPQALARLHEMAGPAEQYLPHVIGDGGPATLHLCDSEGFTGLLPPDERQLAVLTDFPRLAAVTGTEAVTTSRLDDVPEIHRMDLLKVDVQGGELMVLGGAQRLLEQTVAVQAEVGFHRLYDGAPTFAEVDQALRGHGLVPHSFVSARTWPMAPVQWADPMERVSRHLVEADMLYVLDPAALEQAAADRLRRLAVVADGVYSSAGISLRCLLELARRGEVDDAAPQAYQELVRARLGEA